MVSNSVNYHSPDDISSYQGHLEREIWMHIINRFTKCKLSCESNRLIAISGLANLLQRLLGCNYLAGLWEAGLVSQLTQCNCSERLRTEIYQAPSWSWASKPGEIIATDRSAASPVGSQCLGYDYSEKVKEVAKVRDVEEVTREGNPMSPATYARLHLKGILIPTILDSGPLV